MTKTNTIKVLAAGEESDQVEFKQRFTRNIGHTLSAFANTRGGCIYLGVDDVGQVTGVEDINKIKSDMQHLISNCHPSIAVTMRKETPLS